jgi:hypothetical protein
MITILLTVSRDDFLERVISRIELLECRHEDTNFLCIVDGDDALYIRARNLVAGTKFRERLTVRLDSPGDKSTFDIRARRQRIAAAHNQARSLIRHTDGYVFSVEDDTTFGDKALKRLVYVADRTRAFGFAEGVELGRWGVPYIGAWTADDVYDPKEIKSIENVLEVEMNTPVKRIDAGGLYCTLMKAELYKAHEFTSDNGLGPDINFGISIRQMGYENFLVWQVPCTHHFKKMGVEHKITPMNETKVVTLTKESDTKWRESY